MLVKQYLFKVNTFWYTGGLWQNSVIMIKICRKLRKRKRALWKRVIYGIHALLLSAYLLNFCFHLYMWRIIFLMAKICVPWNWLDVFNKKPFFNPFIITFTTECYIQGHYPVIFTLVTHSITIHHYTISTSSTTSASPSQPHQPLQHHRLSITDHLSTTNHHSFTS